MKVIVVGSSHGGYEAVRELLMDEPDTEIQWYEKGDFISFLSCGMQLYLEGYVKNVNDVSYASEEEMQAKGVSVFVEQEITAINPDKHTVHVVNHRDGSERDETYDKLILSSGAVPATLPVEGNDLKNIYAMRGRDWAIKLKQKTVDPDVHNVVIVGSGYIGIEAAEAFANAGMHVTVIDVLPRMLDTYLDKEFTDILTEEMEKNNITAAPSQNIQRFEGKDGKVEKVVTDQATYDADLVVVAAGIKPNTQWLDGTLELTTGGLIKIDDYLQTSAPDVYAVGDATLVKFAPTDGTEARIALATNARRQGRFAAKNALGHQKAAPSVSGSSALALFDYNFASTGIKEGTASNYGVDTMSTLVTDSYRPPFVPEKHGNAKVYFKLTYDPDTTRILGAQIMSKEDVTQNMNVISLAIQEKLTLEDLAYADFFFQPDFDRPWSILNVGAQQALRDVKNR
ncbi:FAD-dependent oxidoreductase [Tetragenococcus koreensis]|uniref:FAD-dependent oxidoreductase n=1 Tax=Tetragenococcus koreensis TaxID=290335 RepID=UPI000F5089C0|nr:FAD-dependent oxidoreductase [Tetragenococcus koreensis]AYW46106.1 FAD-dependent oxidoreductase [Tetragenococcus koreensis]GEN91755.1 NADH peroxidase [Tetragenococcus koreensis]